MSKGKHEKFTNIQFIAIAVKPHDSDRKPRGD